MKILKLFNIILTLMIIGVSFLGFHLVPNFIEMYRDTNLELPFRTQIIISSYKYWFVMLIIPVITYFKFLYNKVAVKKLTKIRLLLMFFLLFISLILLPLFILTSLYLPVFEMADIIDEAEKTGQ